MSAEQEEAISGGIVTVDGSAKVDETNALDRVQAKLSSLLAAVKKSKKRAAAKKSEELLAGLVELDRVLNDEIAAIPSVGMAKPVLALLDRVKGSLEKVLLALKEEPRRSTKDDGVPPGTTALSGETGGEETSDELKDYSRRKIRVELRSLQERLETILDTVGPRRPAFVLDPADTRVAAFAIASALLAKKAKPLDQPIEEYGSGIYALFYKGELEYYSALKGKRHPIYVGKASPTKKDMDGLSMALANRLHFHKKSVKAAEEQAETQGQQNLKVADFEYQYLPVRPGFEFAAEAYLILHYRPVWNKELNICDGFGKHGDTPGLKEIEDAPSKTSGRNNERSEWDTIHPGRKWAYKDEQQPNRKSSNEIEVLITNHLRRNPVRDLDIGELLDPKSRIAKEVVELAETLKDETEDDQL